MKTVWQRLEELLDAGALGEPVPGSAGPAPRKDAVAATAGARAGAAGSDEPAEPALELRDVALPTTAAEATKSIDELGKGRLALAARWNGMPGRSELVGLVLVATEGEEAGLGVMVPARPARRRLGGQEAQQPCWPAPSSATTSRRPCARCCRWAST